MDKERVDDRQELAVRVGAARAVRSALVVLAETLEDREPTAPAEQIELLKGLCSLLSAIGRKLVDIQPALADDPHR
jgi:hypothetical protein